MEVSELTIAEIDFMVKGSEDMLLLDKKNEFLDKIRNNPDTKYTVYFGTKAAPLTRTHEEFIQYCVDGFLKYPNVQLRVGVAESKWKDQFCLSQLVNRFLFEKYSTPKGLKHPQIDIIDQSCWGGLLEFFQKIGYEGSTTLIVVGEDEWKHIAEDDGVWKNVPEFVRKYSFHCAKLRNLVNDDGISATAAREIFYRDPDVDYFYVKKYVSKWVYDYIKKCGYFWQLKPNFRAEENNFLEHYDPKKFKAPGVTVDNVVWYVDKDLNKKILLIRRGGHPYKGYWALPGGFLDVDSDLTLEDAARRELCEETGILRCDLLTSTTKQFKAYSDIGTDPRCRIVDVVYGTHTYEDIGKKAHAGDDAKELAWFNVDDLPKMAFNHEQIIQEYFAQDNVLYS